MRAFGEDLRVRIHEARQAGESTAEVAERFCVSTAFVRRLEQRFREDGSLAARRAARKGPPLRLADHEDALRQAVKDFPDRTPAEHKRHLGLPASVTTVRRTMWRLKLTRKKNAGGRRTRACGREGEA